MLEGDMIKAALAADMDAVIAYYLFRNINSSMISIVP